MVSFILLKVLFWLFIIIWLGVIMFGPESGEGELTKTLKIFIGIIAITLFIVHDLMTGWPIFSSISSILSSILYLITAIFFGFLAAAYFMKGQERYKKEKNLGYKSILKFAVSLIFAYTCWVCLKSVF
jgi:hypothetical protein|tara:strand:+ start:324 stop:707 length:384 start_codon:yes stop_codon:yes gene_type:complete